MSKIEELRVVANNESLSAEERTVASKLLAELEKPKPEQPADLLAQTFANIDAKVVAYRAEQLEKYKVCSVCCLKQSKASERCELCETSGKWESPLSASLERGRCIAASTTYTDDELNYYVANSSINTAFVAHCAKVLELRGVERVRSSWERAGFDLRGHRREK